MALVNGYLTAAFNPSSLRLAAFRNFDNYRTRILFFCGKLELLPQITH